MRDPIYVPEALPFRYANLWILRIGWLLEYLYLGGVKYWALAPLNRNIAEIKKRVNELTQMFNDGYLIEHTVQEDMKEQLHISFMQYACQLKFVDVFVLF